MGKENYFTPKKILRKSRRFLQELKSLHYFHDIEFDHKTSALLVIDMQKYFLERNSHAFIPSAPAIIPNVKKLIETFRKKKTCNIHPAY